MNLNHNFIGDTSVSNYTLNPNFLYLRRSYSTLTSQTLPIPILTIDNLHDKQHVLSKRNLLVNRAGIYRFLNITNSKQYVGSEKILYLRLNEHLSKRKSNRALQSAILKHELENFRFCVYEYFTYENKTTSNKLLTNLETLYIKKFYFTTLYNFMKSATSLEGYKHTDKAKLKMIKRLEDKTNHPFWGKHHNDETKLLISKPNLLNAMYGKTHTQNSRDLMKSKKK